MLSAGGLATSKTLQGHSRVAAVHQGRYHLCGQQRFSCWRRSSTSSRGGSWIDGRILLSISRCPHRELGRFNGMATGVDFSYPGVTQLFSKQSRPESGSLNPVKRVARLNFSVLRPKLGYLEWPLTRHLPVSVTGDVVNASTGKHSLRKLTCYKHRSF